MLYFCARNNQITMKKFYTLILSTLISIAGFSQMTDLIISEYAEGSSNNKYIEIYNGTGSSVNLADYELWRISNGGSWPESTVSLTGTLANGAVLVVANSSADTAITNLPNATTSFSSATFFNGDDAVGLAKDNGSSTFILIDAVGKSGPDPGSGWDVAGTTDATAEHTLVRKSSVCSPDTNWTTSAGTNAANSQWIVYPQNTWTFAGSHVDSCSSSTPTCNVPSNQGATVMATSAMLSWSFGSGNTKSNIEWGTTGFSQGSGTLVTNLSANSYNLTGLMQGTGYDFYVQDSCSATNTLSAWVGPFSFTTLTISPEPTNHVTGFAASSGLFDINLTWVDSDTTGGAQAPDGYLVLGSMGGKAIPTPIDSMVVADDLSFSDSLYAVNVMHIDDTNGTSLSNLMANTAYNFMVYPYTNVGLDIDYKTDGTIPTTSVSTNPIPTYDIATISTTNMTTGNPDSLGVFCKIVGVINSIDFDGNNGYNFYLADSTGGMYAFNFSDINNYQSQIGDEVRLVGEVDVYFGLTEFVMDSITLLSQGNPRGMPQVVTTMDESVEGEFVEIQGLYLADASQWPSSQGGSFNVDMVTPQGDTLIMRVDSDTRIADSITVTSIDTFTAIGNVYYGFGNYQLYPSVDEDIIITGTASCSTPIGLSATTTDTSATLSWTMGPGNAFSNVEWGTTGFAQGSGTLVTGITSGMLTINGLTLGTTYDFYVQDTCASLGGFGAWVGPVSFTPSLPPAIPTYPIGTVTTTDITTFLPDSLNTYCKVQGIVTSVDFDGNAGYNFTIQDATGGIYIYNFADVNGYQSTQGDEIRVVGTIDEYNGLTQIFADSITVISQGNTLPTPMIVTMLDESTENELITIENAMLIDPWPTSTTSSANLDVMTAQGDTITMRIDSDTDILDSLNILSTDTITITGVGGQFTSASIPNNGYQILPSLYTDIVIKPIILQSCNTPTSLGATPGATDAVLSWTTGGSSTWNIEWGAQGFTLGTGTMISGVTSNPYTLTGLMTQTTYDFYVQDTCASLNSSSGWAGPFTFTTTAPLAIPTYDIATITTVDANGEPDSLGVYCKVVGTVFTPDYDGNNGYSFYIQDGTGGINIFNFNDVASGYQSQVGDEIRAIGEVLFYNGLIEIEVDSIVLISQGNAIGQPTVVTTFDASTVSEFIKIEKVKIVDPSQWPAPGDNANIDIATPSGDTLVMRLDRDVQVQDTMTTAPTGFVDITGVGGQFDSQAPYFDNYQIFPRRHTDIVDVDPCPAPTALTAGNITATSADLSWTSANSGAVFNIVWGEAGFLFSQGNVVPGITTTSFTLAGLTPDTDYEFYVQDSCGSFLGNSQFEGPESFSTLVDNINDVERVAIPLLVIPNPANQGTVMINKIGNYTIFNVVGQEVARVINNNRFDAADFETGVYLLKGENGQTIRFVIK